MSSPVTAAVQSLIRAAEAANLRPRRVGGQWLCLCPCHDDKNPSFSFGVGNRGREVVGFCHACGATLPDLLSKLGVGDAERCVVLGPTNGTNQRTSGRTVEERHVYPGADGAVRLRKLRFRGPAGKTFVWEHLDDVGRWQPGRGGAQAPLYNTPALAQALERGERVAVTEGEKCADWVTAAGIVATTNPDGAGKWRAQDSTQLSSAPSVTVFADNDALGRDHAKLVADGLRTAGVARVTVVHFPELPEKGDVADFLEALPAPERAARLLERIELASRDAIVPLAAFAERGYTLQRFSDIESKPIDWLWPGYLPRGAISILEGDPGLGKSTITIDLIARLSRGDSMPDGTGGGRARASIIISAEDDYSRVIRPRLEAAGANLDLVHTLSIRAGEIERDPSIARDDLARLAEAIRESGAELLVFDPLVAFLPSTVDANKDQQVRSALALLKRLVEEEGVACIGLRHLRKAGAERATHRGGGSIGIIGASRGGLLVDRDPDAADPHGRVLAGVKSNLGPLPPSLRFRLEAASPEAPPRVIWCGPSRYGADELLSLNDSPDARDRLAEARDWLQTQLEGEPRFQTQIMEDAEREGISRRTLERAKAVEGVVTRKRGAPGASDQAWEWSLPAEDRQPPPKAAKQDVGVLREPWRASAPPGEEDRTLGGWSLASDASEVNRER